MNIMDRPVVRDILKEHNVDRDDWLSWSPERQAQWLFEVLPEESEEEALKLAENDRSGD